jgi:haloalkane dehalogenase
MILDNNHFIEQSLPATILRSLAPEELSAYRQPFRKREDRLPMLVWPRELPIAGEPADVVSVVETSLRALCNSPIPKLLLTGDPGALVKRPLVEWCKLNIPSLEIASVGPSIHYPQEDQPEARYRTSRVAQASAWRTGLDIVPLLSGRRDPKVPHHILREQKVFSPALKPRRTGGLRQSTSSSS